jgi:hypothetical protein
VSAFAEKCNTLGTVAGSLLGYVVLLNPFFDLFTYVSSRDPQIEVGL